MVLEDGGGDPASYPIHDRFSLFLARACLGVLRVVAWDLSIGPAAVARSGESLLIAPLNAAILLVADAGLAAAGPLWRRALGPVIRRARTHVSLLSAAPL